MSDFITFVNNQISISTNTTTFTDISAWGNSVKVSGGARAMAEEYFFGTDTATVKPGKRAPCVVEVTLGYTEAAADPFAVFARPSYESPNIPLYVKWTPQKSKTGVGTINTFLTDALYPTDPPYPQGDAKADKIIVFSLKGTTAFITTSTTTA